MPKSIYASLFMTIMGLVWTHSLLEFKQLREADDDDNDDDSV